jgi:hypothetical protein
MPKKGGFYTKEVVAPAKTRAGTNPMGTVTLGTAVPTQVPKREAVIHGLGPQTHPFGHPSVKGAHGYGRVARHHGGHQIGKKK